MLNEFFYGGAAAGPGPGPGPDDVERSLRFNSADEGHLTRQPTTLGDRKTWTLSTWVKRNKLGTNQCIFGTNSVWVTLSFNTADQIDIYYQSGNDSNYLRSQAVYRDPSAWYHIVLMFDTTQATDADRVKCYVNGETVLWARSDYPSQNYETGVNSLAVHDIGGRTSEDVIYLDAQLAAIYLIDGQNLTADDFGAPDSNGVWQPKAYTGSYGTNGFHLDFSDNSSSAALGNDSSGNGNDWTVNNLSVAPGAGNDSLIDTPTNYIASSGNNGGNYCTWNPLDINETGSTSDGNLEATIPVGVNQAVCGTFQLTSGKWYWEAVITSSSKCMVGVADGSQPVANRSFKNEGWYYFSENGKKYHANVNENYGAIFGQGDIIGIALNMDAGTLAFYKNGVSQGVAYSTGLSGIPVVPCLGNASSGPTTTVVGNFGQRPFVHPPGSSGGPSSDFKSVCSANLEEPLVPDGSTAMEATTWTGGGSAATITGINHSPDLVWIKQRNTARHHWLFDAVRGAGEGIRSDTQDKESTNDIDGYLSAFTSDGFSYEAGTSSILNVGGLNGSYIGWTWDAGGTTTLNEDGSRNCQVRANQDAGFSIVSYIGGGAQSYGHGLNTRPGLIIIKNREIATKEWMVGHSSLPDGNSLRFNNTLGVQTGNGIFNSKAPTDKIFYVGTNAGVSNIDDNIIAYCWAPVEGYSAFGSYEGTGTSNDSAPFVYTGFRPKFVLIKGDANIDWIIEDSSRDPFNQANKRLYPNDSVAESSSSNGNLDFLSNGFKPRTTHLSLNASGTTYYYACFGEHPFKTARAR